MRSALSASLPAPSARIVQLSGPGTKQVVVLPVMPSMSVVCRDGTLAVLQAATGGALLLSDQLRRGTAALHDCTVRPWGQPLLCAVAWQDHLCVASIICGPKDTSLHVQASYEVGPSRTPAGIVLFACLWQQQTAMLHPHMHAPDVAAKGHFVSCRLRMQAREALCTMEPCLVTALGLCACINNMIRHAWLISLFYSDRGGSRSYSSWVMQVKGQRRPEASCSAQSRACACFGPADSTVILYSSSALQARPRHMFMLMLH